MQNQAIDAGSKRVHPIVSLLAILTLCYAVSFIGAQASFMGLQGWYTTINKPSWNPPSWVFGPVWTVLYGLMGVAAWIVWRATDAQDGDRKAAVWLFLFQLVLNGLWSWIFFAWRQIGPAFFELTLLWAAILATIVAFWKVRPLAGKLLIPYLAWVSFASVLNLAIWRLNI